MLHLPFTAVLAIDVQLDFCPGGALAVPAGDEVVAPCSRLLGMASVGIVTQDWHPPGHASFASSHPGRAPFEQIPFPYGPQTLWPDHCVQGTAGAELHPELDTRRAQLVLRKGHHADIDSYSAFRENDRATDTGLAGYLRERGVTRVVVCGLATDYCVRYSALDARGAGFEVAVVADAVRGLDPEEGVPETWRALAAAGVRRITLTEALTNPT